MASDIDRPEFRPLRFLVGPHAQTIMATLLPSGREPASQWHRVELEDGDRLEVLISTPPGWSEARGTVLLIHGLCGCVSSPYLVRMARKLASRGIRVVRMNQRGAGTSLPLARGLGHAGRSEDVWAVAQWLQERRPSPLRLVGFSLGGNLVVKLAGELGSTAPSWLRQVIAVGAPLDLWSCCQRIEEPGNRFYRRHFVHLLKNAANRRASLFGVTRPIPESDSLFEFDDQYTAPLSGFRDARHYYEVSSALPLLPAIEIPSRLLFARDDPFIQADVVLRHSPSVQVTCTEFGGHLGFLGRGRPGRGIRWMDQRLLAWLDEEC